VATTSEHPAVYDREPYLLTAENLQKSYGDNLALKGLSFSLKPWDFWVPMALGRPPLSGF
jgi:hypothetical protein